MKTALLLVLFAIFSWAQTEKSAAPSAVPPTAPSAAPPAGQPAAPPPTAPGTQKPEQARRLVSLTWDLINRKLIWVVENGSLSDDQFVASSSDHYAVSPDQAFMSVKDQKRSFGEDEATSLRRLLDVLSLYCAESVIWWEQGQPDTITDTPNAKPDGNKKVASPALKPTRVSRKGHRPAASHTSSQTLVAANAAR